jgi:short-subunit dehydrogenase
MEALSDALRVELRDAGIAVCLVEPGPIASAFRENATKRAEGALDKDTSRFGPLYDTELKGRHLFEKQTGLFMRPPEAVAVKVLHALTSRRPRTRYKVTVPAYVGALMSRVAPDGIKDLLMWTRLKRRLDRGRAGG